MPMPIDDLKDLVTRLLKEYERTWQENAVLRAIIESVTMPDGTKGIPNYEEKLAKCLEQPEIQKVTRLKFAELYAKIRLVQIDSELLELLRELPPTGSVQ